jgi:hypothetical protein
MMTRLTWLVAALGLLLIAGTAEAQEFKYVGVKKCKTCHKKELIGNQIAEWKKGKHSKAFETLKSDEAVEIGKKKGLAGPPHEAEDCLKCHVTAYGMEPAAFKKKPLIAKNGIQCESCHGPGSGYRKKKIMSDHDKAVAKGMWEPSKDEKICTTCHNDESPTWDAAKGFDFEARKEEFLHHIPEDVKGKYLEIEKKRKAERRAAGGADEEEDEDEEDED